jgi:hypothetical protein
MAEPAGQHFLKGNRRRTPIPIGVHRRLSAVAFIRVYLCSSVASFPRPRYHISFKPN